MVISDPQHAECSNLTEARRAYHENNVPSRLSPQWLCSNSCTWAHDVRSHNAGTNEPKSAQQAKQRAYIYIYKCCSFCCCHIYKVIKCSMW